MDSREYVALIDYMLNNQSQKWGLVFSFYIYLQFIFADMDEKETVIADRMCSQALAYFYVMAQIRNREHSFELKRTHYAMDIRRGQLGKVYCLSVG